MADNYIDGHYQSIEDYGMDPDGIYRVCGKCGFADATMEGCGCCGATAQDMKGWYK